jgi:hypothetical protein
MKPDLSKSASTVVQQISTLLNISAKELVEQLIESLTERLETDGTVFLAEPRFRKKLRSICTGVGGLVWAISPGTAGAILNTEN